MATTRSLNFEAINDDRTPLPHRPRRMGNGRRMSMTKKQMRERARRSKGKGEGLSEDFALLYKPIEEWDVEELARGRPRSKDGTFKGRAPSWISRELHEEAITRFHQVVRDGMNANTNIAIDTIKLI